MHNKIKYYPNKNIPIKINNPIRLLLLSRKYAKQKQVKVYQKKRVLLETFMLCWFSLVSSHTPKLRIQISKSDKDSLRRDVEERRTDFRFRSATQPAPINSTAMLYHLPSTKLPPCVWGGGIIEMVARIGSCWYKRGYDRRDPRHPRWGH